MIRKSLPAWSLGDPPYFKGVAQATPLLWDIRRLANVLNAEQNSSDGKDLNIEINGTVEIMTNRWTNRKSVIG